MLPGVLSAVAAVCAMYRKVRKFVIAQYNDACELLSTAVFDL